MVQCVYKVTADVSRWYRDGAGWRVL